MGYFLPVYVVVMRERRKHNRFTYERIERHVYMCAQMESVMQGNTIPYHLREPRRGLGDNCLPYRDFYLLL